VFLFFVKQFDYGLWREEQGLNLFLVVIGFILVDKGLNNTLNPKKKGGEVY